MEAKLKHLEFIQSAISRMATNSFLFKGWAITIASGLSAFAAVDRRRAVLLIALISSAMFWALDGYYLMLEKLFRELHDKVAKKDESAIDFSMALEQSGRFKKWRDICLCRPHLWAFYGSIIVIEVLGIIFIRRS